MKKRIISFLTASLMMFTGCASVGDTLPDSYYETIEITDTSVCETQTVTESTTEPITTPPISKVTIPESTSEFITESIETTALSSESETVSMKTETSEFSESEVSETTVTETAAAEQTTAAETVTEQQITVVDIPKKTTVTEAEENEVIYVGKKKIKAVWVSYLEFDRMMKNCTEQEFTENVNRCFDNILSIGCNTVFFQVRTGGDAYYRSSLFPKGDRLTGDYDPLDIAVRSAHSRGLELHAWINPLRLMTDEQMENTPLSYRTSEWYHSDKKGDYLVNSNGRWYLNPAYDEVISLICDGVREIVENYAVDGVQIDDYFYPTTDEGFDRTAFSESGYADLSQFRLANINHLVRSIYDTVHRYGGNAVFGIAPQGNMDNNYYQLYADIYLWCSEYGYCDYIAPQIYWGFDHAVKPFSATLDEWKDIVKINIPIVAGLGAYRTGTADSYAGSGKYEWQNRTDILSRQISEADSKDCGFALFRYYSLFEPEPAVADYAQKELNNIIMSS